MKAVQVKDVVFYVLQGRGVVEIGEEREQADADTGDKDSPAQRGHQDAVRGRFSCPQM